MGEVGLGMRGQIGLELGPEALIVANLLAVGANRNQTLEHFHLVAHGLQFGQIEPDFPAGPLRQGNRFGDIGPHHHLGAAALVGELPLATLEILDDTDAGILVKQQVADIGLIQQIDGRIARDALELVVEENQAAVRIGGEDNDRQGPERGGKAVARVAHFVFQRSALVPGLLQLGLEGFDFLIEDCGIFRHENLPPPCGWRALPGADAGTILSSQSL